VPLIYIISIVLLDVFIFLKLQEVFATLYVNYKKIRLQNTLIMRRSFKTIPCKPKIYFMKNYALALHTFAFLFVSSCNNTKAADEKSRKLLSPLTLWYGRTKKRTKTDPQLSYCHGIEPG
jgi:hypothetical protein